MLYDIGDVVGLKTRKGNIDAVITGTRRVSKGRHAGKWEYKLAPVDADDKTIGFTAVGEQYFTPPSKGSVGKKKKDAAAKTYQDRMDKRNNAIADRDFNRQTTIEEMDPQPGDVILVRNRGFAAPWSAVVADVNYRTGKIGINRHPEAVRRAERQRDVIDMLNYHVTGDGSGRGPVGRGRVQRLSWIQPEAIIKIKRDGKEIWNAKKGKVEQTSSPVSPSSSPTPPVPPSPSPPPSEREPSKSSSSAQKRKVYGAPPGGKKAGHPAKVHTRMKGKVYVPSNPPSKAKSGQKYGMSMSGDNLVVSDDDWEQTWEPFGESIKVRLGDLRKVIKESFKDLDIDRLNAEDEEDEAALGFDPSGRWSSGESLVVGDYVIKNQGGVWTAYTVDDGVTAAGGTPDATKEDLVAWAQDATDDYDQQEDEWEMRNDPDSYHRRTYGK